MPLNLSTVPTYLPYVIADNGNVIIYPNVEPKLVVDGVDIRVFREFCNLYNITLNVTVDEDAWGEVFENRTATGMFSNLLADRADCCCGAIGMWITHWFFIELSKTYIFTRVSCLVPIPGLEDKFDLVVLPFTGSLWTGLLISIIFLTIAFNYICRGCQFINNGISKIVSNQSWEEHQTLREIVGIKIKHFLKDFFENFYVLYRLTVLQPLPESIDYPNVSFRSMLTWILLQTLLISTAYSSGLSAIMTLPQYEKPIKTQQDLIDSKMPWGADTPAWVETIAHSSQPQTIELLKTYDTYTIEQLKQKAAIKFGYLIEQLVGGTFTIPEYATDEIILKSQNMDEEIYWEYIQSAFRKSSPFVPSFNRLVLNLQESGILYAIQAQVSLKYQKYSTQLHLQSHRKQTLGENSNEPEVLSVYDLESVFVMWLVGIIISCICFLYENYTDIKEKLQFW